MQPWEVARNIAIIALAVQGSVILIAMLAAAITGAIAIIETTVKVRDVLHRAATSAGNLHDTVDSIARQKVLMKAIRVDRARARIDTYTTMIHQALHKVIDNTDNPSKD